MSWLKYRDAPEPTGEEGEDAESELPKVYEPVQDLKELGERLEMFLSLFNEMLRGAGMDLVFFPDAMLHLVKVRLKHFSVLLCHLITLFHLLDLLYLPGPTLNTFYLIFVYKTV